MILELTARLRSTWQCICSNWKMLENQSANLQANSGLEALFSSEEGFQVQTAFSLFTVNDPCQLSSVNFNMSVSPTAMHT